MSVPTVPAPTVPVLLRRVADLVPQIRDAAPRTEAARMVSADTIDELRAAGLFQVLQPAAFGGFELAPTVLLRLTVDLARGCPSTGWVYGVLASHAWLLGLFPEQAQRDVWLRDADALVCTATGPPGPMLEPVEGGYRMRDGAFPFSSGCDHADWAIVGCRAPGPDGTPESAWALVPRADVRIEDTWFAAGLRGTGSKTLHVAEAFVPAYRIVAEADLRRGTAPGGGFHANPVYRVPLGAVFPLPLIGTAIGAASGAVAALAARIAAAPAAPAGLGSGHVRLGDAGARLDAALRLLCFDGAEVVDRVAAGVVLTDADRHRYSLHVAMASELCVDAVETAFLGAGGSAILDSNAVQRYWRDVHAAVAHKAFDWDGFRLLYGREVAAGAAVASL